MTEKDLDVLADKIAERIPGHPQTCLLFDEDTAHELKSFAGFLKQGKKTATVTFVIVVVGAILSATFLGFGIHIVEAVKKIKP